MSICYQLVGVPGSGKTTWAQSQTWAKDCVIVSTDTFVENYARSQGLQYSEVFTDYMPTAVQLMAAQVVDARQKALNIIWDQTSTSKISRLRKFRMLPDYYHIAVVFKTPARGELIKRLNSRPGKIISLETVEKMNESLKLDPPTKDEGFKEIWYV